MLISTQKLYEQIKDSNLLIIDSRSFKEYSDGHIPSAINLDLFAYHWFDTSTEGIDGFNNQTTKLFSFAGINSKKKVVFYDNISGMLAARGLWMMRYFSHSDSYVLNGGFMKWKESGFPVEQKTNPYNPTIFDGILNSDLIATYDEVLKELDQATIIDARSEGEYNGKITRAAKGGHIPNAINVDWTKNVNSEGLFKSNKELEILYQIPKDKKIITYCQGAYRAANTFLALRKIGFKNVKVYLGSWGEWGNKEKLPVER
ncbi:MAG: sulfurtransferase [Nitrosopumilaceae archaeon]|nr:sulfurtransferase [Nitrosopumilaceae archaeon]NIT99888.1 sulfurtransferase [Nitrosopumilaceae archaeon]NIU86242.1 sulfurtransferase [Nitrosopumilaceae archaeon]NIV64997.1 sulfurtransferase [Nitrosopumilaceae archaeon]NIX60491.1 sulfurtransferase [Nitrosopumilaceae archaeon]